MNSHAICCCMALQSIGCGTVGAEACQEVYENDLRGDLGFVLNAALFLTLDSLFVLLCLNNLFTQTNKQSQNNNVALYTNNKTVVAFC